MVLCEGQGLWYSIRSIGNARYVHTYIERPRGGEDGGGGGGGGGGGKKNPIVRDSVSFMKGSIENTIFQKGYGL